jgi:predicted MPP superfamily phosphohydrolase
MYPSFLSDLFTWVGSFWLGAMAYLFMIFLLGDIILLINKIFNFIPHIGFSGVPQFRMYFAYAAAVITALILIFGYINAKTPRLHEMDISINKKSAKLKSLKMLVVTDVHLGTLIGSRNASRLVNSINNQHPDIVVFGGDLIDEDIQSVIRHNVGEKLLQIRSKYGVYAVSGNHEYIGGITKSIPYLESHGIRMLHDTAIKIENSFYLVGRDDRDKVRFTKIARKPLNEIIAGADKSMPLILFDHQPIKLNDAISNNIDLQISGHTHHGQIFPFNYITDAIFDIGYGYRKTGNTQFYVSNGYGTWGPPIRVGNRPEMIVFQLKFE